MRVKRNKINEVPLLELIMASNDRRPPCRADTARVGARARVRLPYGVLERRRLGEQKQRDGPHDMAVSRSK